MSETFANVRQKVSKTEAEILSGGANSIIPGQSWVASDTHRMIKREMDGSFTFVNDSMGSVGDNGSINVAKDGGWADSGLKAIFENGVHTLKTDDPYAGNVNFWSVSHKSIIEIRCENGFPVFGSAPNATTIGRPDHSLSYDSGFGYWSSQKRIRHAEAVTPDDSATLGQVNLQEATSGTKGATTNEVTFDGSGKTLQSEMITGWKKSVTELWGSVRGDGILRFLTSIISNLTAGVMSVVDKFVLTGKGFVGAGTTDYNALMNFQDVVTTAGYLSVTSPSVPQFNGLLVSAGTQNGHPAYRIGATPAYIYRGDVTSTGLYWFMDDKLRTADDAWVNALFIHSHKNALTPDLRSFVGRNAQTGTLANVTYESGDAGGLGLSVQNMKVRTKIDVPVATSNTEPVRKDSFDTALATKQPIDSDLTDFANLFSIRKYDSNVRGVSTVGVMVNNASVSMQTCVNRKLEGGVDVKDTAGYGGIFAQDCQSAIYLASFYNSDIGIAGATNSWQQKCHITRDGSVIVTSTNAQKVATGDKTLIDIEWWKTAGVPISSFTNTPIVTGDTIASIAGKAQGQIDAMKRPSSSASPINNGDLVFELTSNTQLKIKVKGSDGVIRSASLTLA